MKRRRAQPEGEVRLAGEGGAAYDSPVFPSSSAPARVTYAKADPTALRVPHDTVNEEVVLVAAFLDADARRRVLREVRPEQLYGQGYAAALIGLAEMERRNLDFSLDTLRQITAGAVDVDYLASMLDRHDAIPPNLAYHIERVHWCDQRVRTAQGPLAELNALFRDLAARPEALAAKAKQLAEELSSAQTGSHVEDPSVLCAQNRAARVARKGGVALYPYGIDGFERRADGTWRVKPGAAPKQLTTLTGLSGSCKSVVAKRIALARADKYGDVVLYGAWEEESGPVLEHLAWMSLGVDRNAVDEGRLTDEEEARLSAEEERLAMKVRFLRRPPTSRKGKVPNRARVDWMANEVARVGAKLFVPDLFKMSLDEQDPNDEELAYRALLRLAQDTDCHVLAVHQQRGKDVEQRTDKRPTREGIKGSGGVVEASFTLIGVHRKGLWKPTEDDTLELIVLKQKNGPFPFSVEFDWDARTASITNGREVKYLPPGEDGGDVDAFVNRRSNGYGRRHAS